MSDLRRLTEMYVAVALGIALGAAGGWAALLMWTAVALAVRQMAKMTWGTGNPDDR